MKETETTTDKPTPERAHSRTEGRGEPRIVQMLNQEAADAEAVAQWLEGNIHNARKQKNCRDRAALYRRVARLYNEDHGEPLTESGAEGVQPRPVKLPDTSHINDDSDTRAGW